MTPLLAQRHRADRAFERMYQRHVGDVYRYALAVMRNPVDAEDVTQTTFLNAYRAYTEKGNRPEKPQNWLIAIAHNVCRQRFRQSSRRPAEVAFEDDIADTLVDDEALTGDDIRRALSHLAFNQRAALVMRELEGRSYAEIAEILELSTSAVETLIFRARRSLAKGLAEPSAPAEKRRMVRGADLGSLLTGLVSCSTCGATMVRAGARARNGEVGARKVWRCMSSGGGHGSIDAAGLEAWLTEAALQRADTASLATVVRQRGRLARGLEADALVAAQLVIGARVALGVAVHGRVPQLDALE